MDTIADLGGKILDGVSFSVERGEAVTIVGPNGAGKTTLLKCLAGILTAGSGKILLDGRPLGACTRRQLARRISYVPQADTRPVPFTVEQFVLMGRYPYLSPFSAVTKRDRQTVREALEEVGRQAGAGDLETIYYIFIYRLHKFWDNDCNSRCSNISLYKRHACN